MNAQILVVEDEPAIRELVAVNLRHLGYTVLEAPDAAAAKSLLTLNKPDVIVLDWMLPGQSGIEFARYVRQDTTVGEIPIIMLTARAAEGDKLQGFDVGVDDYLTKPFSPRELGARVKALLRRTGSPAQDDDEVLELNGLRLETATRRVYAEGKPVELSPTEFRLLANFMRNPERVQTRARLLDSVWGDSVYVEERTVDVHIRRLRLALRPTGLDGRIETVRGGGYRFAPS